MDTSATDIELFEMVRTYVAEDLEGYFGDKFVFDPILVERRVDHDGDEYLRVDIIFDGDQKDLDASWTVGLMRRVGNRLREQGADASLNDHYIKKSEWESLLRVNDRRNRRKQKNVATN